MERTLVTLDDTKQLAQDIITALPATEKAVVIALHGDLGAGKTTFTQQLAAILGVTETVTSPTFVIMKAYQTTHERFERLRHLDAYRIESAEELLLLGWSDWCAEPRTIICIEWAERVASLLPADTIHLTFATVGDVRQITSSGPVSV